MSLGRGTTGTVQYRIDMNISAFPAVWISLRDKKGVGVDLDKERLVFTTDDDEYIVSGKLTQAETLMLADGRIEVQLRAKDGSGNAYKTKVDVTTMERILMEGEI